LLQIVQGCQVLGLGYVSHDCLAVVVEERRVGGAQVGAGESGARRVDRRGRQGSCEGAAFSGAANTASGLAPGDTAIAEMYTKWLIIAEALLAARVINGPPRLWPTLSLDRALPSVVLRSR
jgi:hypothetical protein